MLFEAPTATEASAASFEVIPGDAAGSLAPQNKLLGSKEGGDVGPSEGRAALEPAGGSVCSC